MRSGSAAVCYWPMQRLWDFLARQISGCCPNILVAPARRRLSCAGLTSDGFSYTIAAWVSSPSKINGTHTSWESFTSQFSTSHIAAHTHAGKCCILLQMPKAYWHATSRQCIDPRSKMNVNLTCNLLLNKKGYSVPDLFALLLFIPD